MIATDSAYYRHTKATDVEVDSMVQQLQLLILHFSYSYSEANTVSVI